MKIVNKNLEPIDPTEIPNEAMIDSVVEEAPHTTKHAFRTEVIDRNK